AEGLLPGDTGYVQFRLESPIFAFRGDRFIIRDFTNQETLGGGEILDPFPQKHKRLAEETLQKMKSLESANDEELVKIITETDENIAIPENNLRYYLPYTDEKREQLLRRMEKSYIIRYFIGEKRMIASKERILAMRDKILAQLSVFHKEYPLEEGANYSKIRSGIKADEQTFDMLLQGLIKDGLLIRTGNYLKLSSHQIVFSGRALKISEQIEQIYQKKGFTPPSEEELVSLISSFDKKEVIDVCQAMIRGGKLIKISDDIILHSSIVENTLNLLRDYLKAYGTITVSEFRQLVNTSRKYAVPFLEYCDKIGFTKREGDIRKLI
ncbi:MAG: SelB C-terminal domain-containing protein, partial [Candidatus Poribacteria bacterium]